MPEPISETARPLIEKLKRAQSKAARRPNTGCLKCGGEGLVIGDDRAAYPCPLCAA